MSGGSWDYAFVKIEDWASELKQSGSPLRRALGRRLDVLAVAMHDIEWVDSCDTVPGDEFEAIRKALGESAGELELSELVEEAAALKDKIDESLKRFSAAVKK